MIYVADSTTRKILNKCDAWEIDGEVRMRKWAKDKGLVPVDVEIREFSGDMIIWVA